MQKLLKLLKDKQNLRKFAPVILILIALPLIVLLSLQQQELRQRAATVDCNNGLSCNSCSASSNTCSFGNGTQSCTYTTSLDGSACNPKTYTNVFCFVNNCSAGFTCSNQQCVSNSVPTPTPTKVPTPTPTQPAGGTYTFSDDFTGTSLNSIWHHDFHCCGTITGYDTSLTAVSNGILDMKVVNHSGGWYTDLIDTKTTFTQKYGYFQARIKIPKGKGLWPAFWGYMSGNPEIDTMEICSNQIGQNGGNDASLLHTTVHYSGSGGTNASSGNGYRSSDLSNDYHIYAMDWRSNHINFYLDGNLVWSYTDYANIPNVALPVILNLGIGGSWCSNPDSTTPNPSDMYVDWVKVSP